ncbi:hypothetical protein KI387_038095 [Taxus chinensis]|uniref:Thioredoxin domain-containing protein n=1 Tax=Taxus chinensis TaxID=29808 RepID=A0AA38FVJ3_TAXCH|nr:hypothetical protein KI387_038095 [Taxus chinensis]
MGFRVLRRSSQLCYRFLYSPPRFLSSGSSPFLPARHHAGPSIFSCSGFLESRNSIPRILFPEGYAKFAYSVTCHNMSTDTTKLGDTPNEQPAQGHMKAGGKDGSDTSSMSMDTTKVGENPNEQPVQGPTKAGDKDGSDRTGSKGRSVREGPVTWMSLVLLIITGAGLIIYFDREKKRRIEELKNLPAQVKEGPSVGKAAIGGPFTLVNHEGKSVTERDFMGKWTLIYFGFTHCPDICPDELVKMAAAIDKIKKTSEIEVVPVFISVDPDRDTVEQVREYVKEFHPNLVGLTGSQSDIRRVAREFRVYYMKTEEEEEDYLVDHSIIMYLMDPDMEFVKFFGKNYDVDALTEGVIKEIKGYKK